MTQDYIRALRQHLKDFSREEREALIEEINSHIESSEDDPKMGKDREERKEKLMAELGSPEDMSDGFKALYRNDRLIDYLFIAIPYLLYPLLYNMLYISLIPNYSWADVRLYILIQLPLILVGLWRRSALLSLFWTTTIVTQIMTMLLITRGYYGNLQISLWLLFTLGLLSLIAHVLRQNRHDALVSAFGLLPLLMCLVGSILAMIHPGTGTPYIPGSLDRLLLSLYTSIASFGGGYLPFLGTLVSMALFFLVINRNMRWLAMGLYGLVIALSRNYLNVFDSDQGLMYPVVYSLYVVVPLVLVPLGWWLGQSGHQAQMAE